MAAKGNKKTDETETKPPHSVQAVRETVESIVVAIILALLFRAFVAEAFVIPTGSMAPTLMGTHKDLNCPYCGINYRTGASVELADRNTNLIVVGTVCPNCRAEPPLDLAGNANDATFSGDRILVSKFSYAFGKPQRFDVGVFKNPNNAKQNYIKRIVGLPDETVRISNGDIYTRGSSATDFQMARKESLRKLLSMSHLVYDSDYQSKPLLDAQWPTRWQPWEQGAQSPPQDSWQTDATPDGFTATLDKSTNDTAWLRYYHNWADEDEWNKALQGISLASANPYRVRPITDDYAYNGYITVGSWKVLSRSGGYTADFRSGDSLSQFDGVTRGKYSATGAHWVGDLLLEADVEIGQGDGIVSFVLVRAGVKYTCEISAADGKATLTIIDGETERPFASGDITKTTLAGDTGIGPGDRFDVRFSNYDDELRLWIDGSEVEFDIPATYDSRTYRSQSEDRPFYTADDPLDGAPVLIGVSGTTATVRHTCILRDKYYIAVRKRTLYGDPFNDYSPDEGVATDSISVAETLADPSRWNTTALWKSRRVQEYTLDENQYFPLGDNSPESADARGWTDHHFVPRDLLVGKAVFVFWPHPWNSPVPFTPNIRRMKLIH